MNQNYLQFNQNTAQLPRNNSLTERRSCFKCRWEGDTAQLSCPRCGKRLFSRANIRVRGAVMIVIGLFLSGLMSAITIFITALLADAAKKPGAATQLETEPDLLILMYVTLGGVIAAGVAAILNGIWMLAFGRRNLVLLYIFLGLLGVVFVTGGIFTRLSN